MSYQVGDTKQEELDGMIFIFTVIKITELEGGGQTVEWKGVKK